MSPRRVKRSQARTWLKFIFQTDSIPPQGLIDPRWHRRRTLPDCPECCKGRRKKKAPWMWPDIFFYSSPPQASFAYFAVFHLYMIAEEHCSDMISRLLKLCFVLLIFFFCCHFSLQDVFKNKSAACQRCKDPVIELNQGHFIWSKTHRGQQVTAHAAAHKVALKEKLQRCK